MNSSSLFIPTYGSKKGEDGATAGASVADKDTGRTRRRVLPSTTVTPQSKRSLLPSMVFNGNIEYVQVQSVCCRLNASHCLGPCFACVIVSVPLELYIYTSMDLGIVHTSTTIQQYNIMTSIISLVRKPSSFLRVANYRPTPCTIVVVPTKGGTRLGLEN